MEDCLRQITQTLPVEQLLLFGSSSRGEATEDSDVDLCVITPAAESQMAAARTIRKALWAVHACPPLTLLPITPERLREKKGMNDPFIEDILLDGIPLLNEN